MTNTEKEIAFDEIHEIIKRFREEINGGAGGSAYLRQCAANDAFVEILNCVSLFEGKTND